MSSVTTSEILTDAIRYWEPRRIPYNAVLSLIVIVVFAMNWPAAGTRVGADLLQMLFVLAVLANVAYCAVYVADVTVQLSAFRSTWKRRRWMLFALGLLFAAVLTRFLATKPFGQGPYQGAWITALPTPAIDAPPPRTRGRDRSTPPAPYAARAPSPWRPCRSRASRDRAPRRSPPARRAR